MKIRVCMNHEINKSRHQQGLYMRTSAGEKHTVHALQAYFT